MNLRTRIQLGAQCLGATTTPEKELVKKRTSHLTQSGPGEVPEEGSPGHSLV
jgi:hypothetical protein